MPGTPPPTATIWAGADNTGLVEVKVERDLAWSRYLSVSVQELVLVKAEESSTQGTREDTFLRVVAKPVSGGNLRRVNQSLGKFPVGTLLQLHAHTYHRGDFKAIEITQLLVVDPFSKVVAHIAEGKILLTGVRDALHHQDRAVP